MLIVPSSKETWARTVPVPNMCLAVSESDDLTGSTVYVPAAGISTLATEIADDMAVLS